MLSSPQKSWIQNLNGQLPDYLQKLASPTQTGRFLPCEMGVTELGKSISLGYSCFALKTYYMTGLWHQLDTQKKVNWLDFINSYQIDSNDKINGFSTFGAFIDKPLIDFHNPNLSLFRKVVNYFSPPKTYNYQQAVIFAETKQALSTLFEVGAQPDKPYTSFMDTPEKMQTFFASQDWTRPWGAGGQASAQVVFVKTQSPLLMDKNRANQLANVCVEGFNALADPSTGLYFSGKNQPRYGEAINGAMKVLTALDWLSTPVHYPEKLIDTCLSQYPPAEGCYLVDAAYVLYRCVQQTEYKRREIQEYGSYLLDMIQQHFNPDGGFSYYIHRSQQSYYGLPITNGLDESDIHGTVLLTWAVTMILDLLDSNFLQWKVIKP